MKPFFATLLLGLVLLSACSKDESAPAAQPTLDSLSMEAKYVKEIYYSLANGAVKTMSYDDWDIAFATEAQSSSILVNEGANVGLWVIPTPAGWAWGQTADTAGVSATTRYYNSDHSWAEGAFGAMAGEHPDYGWGIYDMVSHNLSGSKLFLVKTRSGAFKKVFIAQKLSAQRSYQFRISNVDGSDEKTVTLTTADYDNKNFVYYNLETGTLVDREPVKTDWDILFTYYQEAQYGSTRSVGALLNSSATGLALANTAPEQASFNLANFEDNMGVIGSAWKKVNYNTFQWEIPQNVYFVKTADEKVYRLVFKRFDGSSSGKFVFEKYLMN